MEEAVITRESIIDRKIYHTVYELKNGQGPAPLKTPAGLAAPGPWCTEYGRGTALCTLSFCDGSERSFQTDL